MKVGKVMSGKKMAIYGGIVVAMLVATFAAPAIANDDMQTRLDAAEAKIASLEAKNEPTWIQTRRSQETKAMVQEIMADADARTLMLADDKPVTVNLGGFAITRWDYNNGGGAARNNEFNIPYARLEVSGEVLNTIGYYVSGEFSDYTSGSMDLVDAYLTMDTFWGINMQAGQFVTAFYKDFTDSPLDNIEGEYSILATTFGQGRSQGIQLTKDFGWLDLSASYNDGFGTENVFIVDNDYGVSVRGDVDFGGGFNLGAAFAYQSELEDYGTYTVDFGYSSDTLNAQVSWVSADYAVGGYEKNYGFNAGVSYKCTDSLTGFVNYQWGKLGVATSDLNVLEVGANYDINKYVRWTTTLGYGFSAIDPAWNLYRSGWSSGDSDGQYLLRTQLSVSF